MVERMLEGGPASWCRLSIACSPVRGATRAAGNAFVWGAGLSRRRVGARLRRCRPAEQLRPAVGRLQVEAQLDFAMDYRPQAIKVGVTVSVLINGTAPALSNRTSVPQKAIDAMFRR